MDTGTVDYFCYKDSEHGFKKGDVVPVKIIDEDQVWTKYESHGRILLLGITHFYSTSEEFKGLNLVPLKEYRKMKLNQLYDR